MHRFKCGNCGSSNVSMKTWLDWDVLGQKWVPDNPNPDSTFCVECETEDVKLIKVELLVSLTELKPPAPPRRRASSRAKVST